MLIFILVYFLLTANLNNLRGFSEVILGLYVIHEEGASEEDSENIGVVIEGMMLLHHLKCISFGIVVLFVLIYALNLSYSHVTNCNTINACWLYYVFDWFIYSYKTKQVTINELKRVKNYVLHNIKSNLINSHIVYLICSHKLNVMVKLKLNLMLNLH